MSQDIPRPPTPEERQIFEALFARYHDEKQDKEALKRTIMRAVAVLQDGEEIHDIAVQYTMYATSPDAVVVTDQRAILYRAKIGIKADRRDHYWGDLNSIGFEEKRTSATVSFETRLGEVHAVKGLLKDRGARLAETSRRLHAAAMQAPGGAPRAHVEAPPAPDPVAPWPSQDAAWEEVKPAPSTSSSKPQPASVPSAPPQPVKASPMAAATDADNVRASLEKLKDLHADGLINDEEYVAKKQQLLDRL